MCFSPVCTLQHAAIPDLDSSTSFFAVYDGHGGIYAYKDFFVLLPHPQQPRWGLKHPPQKEGKISFCGGITILELNDLMAGKVVAKFCAKFLHKELLTDEGYLAGDLSASVRRAFLRLLSCYGDIVQLFTLQHPLWAPFEQLFALFL